jgi:hypothetical protein
LESFERYAAPVTTHNKPRTINQTDPDSAVMTNHEGKHSCYNVQAVVDDQHGLLVNVEVTHEATDFHQFATQIRAAEETLGTPCAVACADAGYTNTAELAKIESATTTVVVPSQRQVHPDPHPFNKSRFRYDPEADCYYCPEGHPLPYSNQKEQGNELRYRIRDPKICRSCPHDGFCTRDKLGRGIVRLVQEAVKEQIEKHYTTPEYQDIYRRRKSRVELVFGYLKYILGIRQFNLRGREGVLAEISLGALSFNLTRMIQLWGGVQGFMQMLRRC